MKQFAIVALVAVAAFLVSCKGPALTPEQEAKVIAAETLAITVSTTAALNKASSGKETADAFIAYAEGMKKVIEKGKEFQKKNPTFDVKNNPAMKGDEEKTKKIAEEFMGAMIKAGMKYGQSPEVKEAQKKLMEIMK